MSEEIPPKICDAQKTLCLTTEGTCTGPVEQQRNTIKSLEISGIHQGLGCCEKSNLAESPDSQSACKKVNMGGEGVPQRGVGEVSIRNCIKKVGSSSAIHCPYCGGGVPLSDWHDQDCKETAATKASSLLSGLKKTLMRLFIDFVTWVLMNVYFREVSVVNEKGIPKSGAVIFYGNHQNQFIDAMLIRANCGRHVRFVMAEKSFHRPIVGFFGRITDAVPVVRPHDVPFVVGDGLLVRVEGDRVYGEGTTFTKSVIPKHMITWQKGSVKCSAQVREILTDTELLLTLPVAHSDVVTDPLSYKISPCIDHTKMYASVYETLLAGQCVGTFPEGGSHDRTSLLPLKAGVAIYCLGAAARGINVTVVPCGLTYFYGHKFRSRAHVEFGDPVVPSPEIVELFNTNKREAVRMFLDILNKELLRFTINVPNKEALNFLHGFRRLYQPPNCILATRDYLRISRRLSTIMEQQKDNPEFVAYRKEVESYQDYCKALYVCDSQVATLSKLGSDEGEKLRLLVRRLFTLFLLLVTLVPMFVVGCPIGILAKCLSERHRKKALSESSVKVAGEDVMGSYKIIVGFVSVPAVFFIVSLVAYLYTDLRTAFTLSVCLPMAMYVSLLILQDAVIEIRATLPLFVSFMSGHKQFQKLHDSRQKLVERTKKLVHKWSPELEDELQQYVQESGQSTKLREPSLFSLRHGGLRRLANKSSQ